RLDAAASRPYWAPSRDVSQHAVSRHTRGGVPARLRAAPAVVRGVRRAGPTAVDAVPRRRPADPRADSSTTGAHPWGPPPRSAVVRTYAELGRRPDHRPHAHRAVPPAGRRTALRGP